MNKYERKTRAKAVLIYILCVCFHICGKVLKVLKQLIFLSLVESR